MKNHFENLANIRWSFWKKIFIFRTSNIVDFDWHRCRINRSSNMFCWISHCQDCNIYILNYYSKKYFASNYRSISLYFGYWESQKRPPLAYIYDEISNSPDAQNTFETCPKSTWSPWYIVLVSNSSLCLFRNCFSIVPKSQFQTPICPEDFSLMEFKCVVRCGLDGRLGPKSLGQIA